MSVSTARSRSHHRRCDEDVDEEKFDPNESDKGRPDANED